MANETRSCPFKDPITKERCGTLHSRSGPYCKPHHNQYMREYQKNKRTVELEQRPALGEFCFACDHPLRANFMKTLVINGEAETFCTQCETVLIYLTLGVTSETRAKIVQKAQEIAEPQVERAEIAEGVDINGLITEMRSQSTSNTQKANPYDLTHENTGCERCGEARYRDQEMCEWHKYPDDIWQRILAERKEAEAERA